MIGKIRNLIIIVTLAALGFAIISYLRKGNSSTETLPQKQVQQTEHTEPSLIPPTIEDQPEVAPFDPVEAGGPYSDDPRDEIAAWQADPESRWLSHVAVYYGRRGSAKAIEFINALPPGESLRELIYHAIIDLPDPEVPKILEWLSNKPQGMSEEWVETGVLAVAVSEWASSDLSEAVRLGTQGTAVTPAQFIDTALNACEEQGEMARLVTSLDTDDLKVLGKSNPGYLESRISEEASGPLIEELLMHSDQTVRERASETLARVLPEISNRGEVLSAIVACPFPERDPMVSSAVADWVKWDMNEALEWTAQVEDVPLRDSLISESLQVIARLDPSAATAWAEEISDPASRELAKQELTTFLNQ